MKSRYADKDNLSNVWCVPLDSKVFKINKAIKSVASRSQKPSPLPPPWAAWINCWMQIAKSSLFWRAWCYFPFGAMWAMSSWSFAIISITNCTISISTSKFHRTS